MKRSKKSFRVLALVCAAIAVGVPPAGAEPITITERTAVDLALANNDSIEASRYSTAAVHRSAETAWNVFVPTLSVGGTLTRTNEETNATLLADPYSWTAVGTASAQLAVSPSTIPEIEAARLDGVAATFGHRDLVDGVEEQARLSFYSLVYQREQLAVARADIEVTERNLESTRANYTAGLAPLTSVRRAELAVTTARLQLVSLETSWEDALASFRTILGLPPDAEVAIVGEIGAIDSVEPAGGADVAQLEAQLAAQRMRERTAEFSRWSPTVQLAASYSPALPDPWNGDNVAHEWTDRGSISVSLSFALDGVLPFSRGAVAEQTADLSAEALRVRLDQARRSENDEHSALLRRLASAEESIVAQEINVELTEEILDLTEEAWHAGAVDFSTLDGARQDLLEARLALLGEQYSRDITLIQIDYVGGTR